MSVSISYNQIPTNWREPGWLAEQDNSGANSGASGGMRTIIFGQRLPIGEQAALATSALIRSEAQAQALFGKGSMLHRMARAWLYGNKISEMVMIPVDDKSDGSRAAGSVAVVGTALANGILELLFGGSRAAGRRAVGVSVDDTAADVATAIKNAVNDYGDELSSGALTVGVWYEITARDAVNFVADGAANNLVGTIFCATSATVTLTATDKVKPISNDLALYASVATATPTVVALTAKHKGTLGNHIPIRLNYWGETAGQRTPAGLALNITQLTGGAGDPDLTDALAALGDAEAFAIINPYADSTNLDMLATEIDDRWGPISQEFGHVFTAAEGSVSELGVFGETRNDPGLTCWGSYNGATPLDEQLAARAAVAVFALENDPARPLHTLPVRYVLPASSDDRFGKVENNILLYDGISPTNVAAGSIEQLSRVITMYRENSNGDADDSYLDVTTRYTLPYINNFMRAWVMGRFPRHKLVANGTPIPDGHAATTPDGVKTEMIAAYGRLQDLVVVQGMEAYKGTIVCDFDTADPKRLAIEHTPILAGQLGVVAVKTKFYLSLDQLASAA